MQLLNDDRIDESWIDWHCGGEMLAANCQLPTSRFNNTGTGRKTMNSHDPTKVYAARDEIDATLVQSMLAEAGIEARVVGGEITGAIGGVPAGLPSAPRVWVTDENAETARRLIREMEEKRADTWRQISKIDDEQTKTSEPSLGEQVATAAVIGAGAVLGVAAFGVFPGVKTDEALADHGEVWKCSGCHESVTVDFEICWNCQQPRISDDSVGDATDV